MVYYSMMGLIENNVPEFLYEMHRRGLTKYSMRRPDKFKLTEDELKYGGIPSTDTKLLNTQAQFLEKVIDDHIGYAKTDEFREIGSIGNCPHDNLLTDFLKFDLGNRTKFDLTVAAGLAVYGSQKFALKPKTNNLNVKGTDFYGLTQI